MVTAPLLNLRRNTRRTRRARRHHIQFVDGNYDNVTLENLRCVSRAAAAVEAMRKSDTVARAAKIWQTRRLRMAQDASKPFSKAA